MTDPSNSDGLAIGCGLVVFGRCATGRRTRTACSTAAQYRHITGSRAAVVRESGAQQRSGRHTALTAGTIVTTAAASASAACAGGCGPTGGRAAGGLLNGDARADLIARMSHAHATALQLHLIQRVLCFQRLLLQRSTAQYSTAQHTVHVPHRSRVQSAGQRCTPSCMVIRAHRM
jgi:hypothetical protein